MENVILVIHLILALCLIGIVLLQRSEGGGLGIGGGGGGATTGRPPASPMTKLTWAFAAAFLTTSVVLTIISAQNSANSSVIDLLPPTTSSEGDVATPPALPDADALLPPSTGDAPLTPPRAE